MSVALLSLALAASPQLPLRLYTDADWPQGVDLGSATGASFGDWNADGFPDLFVCNDGKLWRNLGPGWEVAADLNDQMGGGTSVRYGAGFGDWDRDGLPDIATEPRKGGADDCLHLLHNRGGGVFVDIAGDPQLLDQQPCGALSETVAWADFDGDRDLDLFFPAYPPEVGSTGNRFLQNLGPTGPGGATRFADVTVAAGVEIPAEAARPEGVVVHDLDADGDLDLYSNGHWYRNLSTYDAPVFVDLASKSSGVKKRKIIDEGTVLVDYDHDGDLDLLVSYTANRGNRLWVNRGDGTFSEGDKAIVEDYLDGAGYGISIADWDHDGDFDFTANDVFRESLLMDTGEARWVKVASPDVPHVGAPAWADIDRDGDVDLATADGGPGRSFLYENTTYDATTQEPAKRTVRVRVVDEQPGVPGGVETEYGARVELRMLNARTDLRFVQVVAPAAGYINQNEYPLTFSLPADPEPGEPETDVRFDLVVRFPSLPDVGLERVDKWVNPACGNIDLALLDEREIVVFRSGKVRLGSREFAPQRPGQPLLLTTTGGLAAPPPDDELPELTVAGNDHTWVGTEFSLDAAEPPMRVTEVLLDGQPGASGWCGTQYGNLAVWDVDDRDHPKLLAAYEAMLPDGNRRADTQADVVLAPGRTYRVVAHVDSYRATDVVTPWNFGGVEVAGGLLYGDPDPCSGQQVSSAAVISGEVYLAVRLRPDAGPRWFALGHGDGRGGTPPELVARGVPRAGAALDFVVQGADPGMPVRLVAGARLRSRPVDGVLVHPVPSFRVRGKVDASGKAVLSGNWPTATKPGFPIFFQAVVGDDAATAKTTPIVGTVTERRP